MSLIKVKLLLKCLIRRCKINRAISCLVINKKDVLI